MNIDELRMLGKDCYAAFNQNAPDFNGRAWTLWAETCADIPVAASQFIRGKIIDLESMPRNFGKAVRQYGQEWRYSKGIAAHVFQECPDCDKGTPGFFYAWDKMENGKWHRLLVRCHCNQGKPVEGMLHMTKNQAACAGYEVVPQGFGGGMLVYELQLMGITASGEVDAYIKAARSTNLKQRRSHLDALAEAETDRWQ